MGIVQRCEVLSRAIVVRCWARRLYVDGPVALIKKGPAASTIGFDAVTTLVWPCMMGTAQQHEIRQCSLATVGPVFDVMIIDVTAVRATRKNSKYDHAATRHA